MKPLYKEKYPHVFQPLTVGRRGQLTFKNRLMVPPIGSQGDIVDSHHRLNRDGVEFYMQFARGGAACFTVPMEIPPNGGHRGDLVLDDKVDGFIYLHNLQRPAHMYGAKTLCEIYHAGCCMLPETGYTIMSASSFVYNGNQVKEMDEKDMENVTRMYVDAAVLAMRSGFDGICLHYGHGWLMNNFLSPLSNHRTDKYGGKVENRIRFPKAVIRAIREAIGYDMIIELRINGSDKKEGGITPDDAALQALLFEDEVDMIHVSCGTRLDAFARPKMHPTCFVPDAHNADAAETLKKAGVKIPVGVVGAISSAALADRLIAEGKCDYVLVGRQSVADPAWINKTREGREEDIRPCIRCDYCLDGGRRSSHTTQVSISHTSTFDGHCSVNPFFRQGYYKLHMLGPTTPKKVAVIGGGVAGMQAALSACERGHDVTLFEKTDRLGGQLFFSDHMAFKNHIRDLRDYFITQLRKSSVTVLLNTEATPELVSDADFDAVIVALGGIQTVPSIPGVDCSTVRMAWDVFGHEEELGRNIVIVGGGSVGCELAIHLASKGHKPIVLEMTEWLAASSQISERMSIREQFELHGIDTRMETLCIGIEPCGVRARAKDGGEYLIEADNVIISAGTTSRSQARDAFANVAFDVINVGDCKKASNMQHAVETGFDAGIIL